MKSNLWYHIHKGRMIICEELKKHHWQLSTSLNIRKQKKKISTDNHLLHPFCMFAVFNVSLGFH